jgi:hypothetical protein
MLPKAVREAGERADALMQPSQEGNTEVASAPAPAPADAPAAQAAPEATPAPALSDDWEVKYRVLAGKYSAEVPRLTQEIRELKDKLREAESKPAAPVAAPVVVNDASMDAVREQYGDDFANAVSSVATQIASAQVAKVRDELAPKVEAATSSAAITSRQAFLEQLTRTVTDWAVIDADPGFTAFLDEIDDLSGQPRRAFFSSADAANDANRVARFFSAYRERSSAKPPSPQQAVASNHVEYSLQPQTTGSNVVPDSKRMWSQADVRKFYTDARRGLYSEQEYERIESDIFAAQRDGRFMGG